MNSQEENSKEDFAQVLFFYGTGLNGTPLFKKISKRYVHLESVNVTLLRKNYLFEDIIRLKVILD